MIWLIIYLIISLIISIYYTKRLKAREPEIEFDEVATYFVVCFLFWPYIGITSLFS